MELLSLFLSFLQIGAFSFGGMGVRELVLLAVVGIVHTGIAFGLWFDALGRGAAQLPRLRPGGLDVPTGRNTEEALRLGARASVQSGELALRDRAGRVLPLSIVVRLSR